MALYLCSPFADLGYNLSWHIQRKGDFVTNPFPFNHQVAVLNLGIDYLLSVYGNGILFAPSENSHADLLPEGTFQQLNRKRYTPSQG